MNDNYQKYEAPVHSSERYMNAYERARARQHMEQAMALADWSIRAWDGLRAALNRAGSTLRRTVARDRQRADEAVAHRS
jgi:hypothetical protein